MSQTFQLECSFSLKCLTLGFHYGMACRPVAWLDLRLLFAPDLWTEVNLFVCYFFVDACHETFDGSSSCACWQMAPLCLCTWTFEELYGSETWTWSAHLYWHLCKVLQDYGPAGVWYWSFERCNDLAQLGSFHKNTYTHPHTWQRAPVYVAVFLVAVCVWQMCREEKYIGFEREERKRRRREEKEKKVTRAGIEPTAAMPSKPTQFDKCEKGFGLRKDEHLKPVQSCLSEFNCHHRDSVYGNNRAHVSNVDVQGRFLSFFFWLRKVRWAWRRWTSIISVLVHDQVWPAEIKCWSFPFTSSPM